MSKERSFDRLVAISDNLENYDYEDIKKLIQEAITRMPICTAMVYEGASIDRARLNRNDELFTNVSQLSYKSDASVLAMETEFGRANKPRQAMFHGSIISTKIDRQRVTAIAETTSLLGQQGLDTMEIYTVSRWYTKHSFEVAQMVFSKEAIANNPDTKEAYEHQLSLLEKFPEKDLYIEQLSFFSDQFARKKRTHHDYKISCAFTELILLDYNTRGIKGVAYPSVATDYQGINLALLPDAVDKSLELSTAAMFKFYVRGKKAIGDNYKYIVDLGKDRNSFVWDDVSTHHKSTQEQIESFLNQS